MKKLIVACLMLMPAAAQAALPDTLWCRRELSDGRILTQSFDFKQDPRDIWPPIYDVSILVKRLPVPTGNPDDPVSSDDPVDPNAPRPEVLLRGTYSGQRDARDEYLIYFFGKEGFVRADTGPNGSFTVTYQVPGQRLPAVAENCAIPEAGVTVHN